MTRWTLRIVVRTLFGSGLDAAEADRVGGSLTALLEHFEWLVTHPLGPLRLRLPTPRIAASARRGPRSTRRSPGWSPSARPPARRATTSVGPC